MIRTPPRTGAAAESSADRRGRRTLYRLVYAGFAVWFLAFFLARYDPDYGYSQFITFGDWFQERSLSRLEALDPFVEPDSDGYDGQFYAQLALSPALDDPELQVALDNPIYRARRILFPATAYLLGLGQDALILQAYALQNLLAWALLAWLMTRWLPPRDLGNLLRWLGCLFSLGLFQSCARALLDGPGMLLIALAVLMVERKRQNLATAVLALAALGKETNLLAAVSLPPPGGTGRKVLTSTFARGLAVVLPLLLWFSFVLYTFDGNLNLGRNFGIPLHGYWFEVTEIFRGLSSGDSRARHLLSLLCLIGFTAQVTFLAFRRRPASAWWRVGAAYAVLGLFLAAKVWAGSPGSYLRVLLPMTFAFNLLLPTDPRRFIPLWVVGNLGLLVTVSRLTSGLLW